MGKNARKRITVPFTSPQEDTNHDLFSPEEKIEYFMKSRRIN